MEKHVVFVSRSAVAMSVVFGVFSFGLIIWAAQIEPLDRGIFTGALGVVCVMIALAFTATSSVGFAVAEVLKQQGERIGELERLVRGEGATGTTVPAKALT